MDATDKVLNEANNIFAQVGQTISSYAPKTWQIFCAMQQADAISKIVVTAGLFILGTVFALFLNRKVNGLECKWSEPSFAAVACMICTVLAIITFIVLVCDPWWFITAVNPQLGAAHSIYAMAVDRLTRGR